MKDKKMPRLNLHLASFQSRRSGFTLIEILVAIAIMAIVFGFIIASAGSLQRRARDQQRISDLQRIQAALAQYYADNHYYPICLHPDVLTSFNNCTGNFYNDSGNHNCNGDNPVGCTPNRSYLVNFPHDPEDDLSGSPLVTHYCYVSYTQYTPDSDADQNRCFNVPTPSRDVTNCRYYKLYAPQTDISGPAVTCYEDRNPHTRMLLRTDTRGS
jgi:prepilin-type N-terminal cleavage/methylation domain-containing protein